MLGCLAAMRPAGHAIGHHREHPFGRRQPRIRLDEAAVILVTLARPGGGGVAELEG